MKASHGLIVLFGYAGLVFALPKDPALTDETYLRQQIERNRAQAREVMRIRDEKRKEFLDRSRIGGAGDSCLAYAVETGDCRISAAEFDQGVMSRIPDSLEFQSGESLALKARKAQQAVSELLLDRAFLDAYRPEDSPRSPDPGARKTGQGSRGAFDGYDAPTLLRAFPEIRAQVVAASDSAWLATGLEDSRNGILATTLPAWELPDSVLALLAQYPRGEWTPIRRVAFGFLACSWLDSLPASGTLAKIRPRLDPSRAKSALRVRSQAIDSLRKHGDWCQDEDTLAISLRLAPALRSPSRMPGPAWISANSTVLPASVKGRLWTKFDHGAPDTLGPFRSVYGTWMLAPSSRDIRDIVPGKPLDSAACLARVEARLWQEDYAKRIRSEWEMIHSKEMNSKEDCNRNGDARTALLERLSRQGARPESSYRRMRERWVSQSLRFTRNLGFLDAATETGSAGAYGAP